MMMQNTKKVITFLIQIKEILIILKINKIKSFMTKEEN